MLTPRRTAVLAISAALSSVGVAAATGGASQPGLAGWLATHAVGQSQAAGTTVPPATPRARCGPGSLPETGRQGRVPLADYSNGRAEKGYTCNAAQVAHTGTTGGFKTFRYTDTKGRTCAYYDGTLLFPTHVFHQGETSGVHVLDMTNPAKPVETARLVTAAMDSPHESLALNATRGLLAAGMGSPITAPGVVDVYDVSQDCRHPVLRSTSPLGFLGHESGFSPDGRTLWISTTAGPGVTAIDLTDPALPSVVWHSFDHTFHGMSLSADGTRLYGSAMGDRRGLTVLDVSQVQRRVANSVVREVSHLTWPEVSIPQNSVPITVKGKRYLLQFDEYARDVTRYDPDSPVGAARIISIEDEKRPRVVSTMRLEVHQPAARAGDQKDDPGAQYGPQGYAAHYCSVPRTADPGIVACSFILSGLRVFNIEDPTRPREVAYFNKPAPNTFPLMSGSYAMSAPSFDVKRQHVWFADGDSGFYVVKLTNGAWPKRLV